jgi:hypothetical protein
MSHQRNTLFMDDAMDHFQERKEWHNLGATFGVRERCRSCNQALSREPKVYPDPVGIEYYDVCINPECKEFGKEYL